MKDQVLSAKPHYPILDGLRGVAAVTVVIFHIFEAHATSHLDQVVNHGYLAVDFFFLLSGFVIGYAYDDRWHQLTVPQFFRRRLERLQPMVVMGMLIGAACFYFQASPMWPGISEVPVWKMLLIMLIGCTLIPVPLSMDIRGWQEMHPLNGPGWSLFFEYIANILYALFVRKFSKTVLSVFVVICGALLIRYAVTSATGDMIGGWSLEPAQLRIGFTRMLFPFFAGLLLCRTARLVKVKYAFTLTSLLLLVVLAMPRIGGQANLWMNGLYDSLSIILLFPLIVYLGAGGETSNGIASRISRFLGELSYPLYITHYPLIYIYTGWAAANRSLTWDKILPNAVLCFVGAIVLAYACLKLYDEPVRRWLKRR